MTVALASLAARDQEAVLHAVVAVEEAAEPVGQGAFRALTDPALREDVANALGVSRAMVSYWEAGSRVPNDRQLAALSRLLRTPIAVLVGAEEPTPAPDVAAILMRGADHELPDDAFPGLREFVEFLDAYADLAEAARFSIRGMSQSPFVSGAGFESADDARRKAEEVRAYLRVGLGPIGDIVALCELLGLTVCATWASGTMRNRSRPGRERTEMWL